MKIEDEKQYFYTIGGEKQNPVTGAELKGMAAAGRLNQTMDLVWAEGAPDWVPSGACEDLFAAPPAAKPQPAAAQSPPPSLGAAPASARPENPPPPALAKQSAAPSVLTESKSSFGLYLTFSAIAFALGTLGKIVIGVGAADQRYRSYGFGSYGYHSPNYETMGAGALIFFLSCIPWIVAVVLSLIYLNKAWRLIQGLPGVKATPNEAVGFLFTPVFNIFYWMFVAWPGWAGDYNRLNRLNQDPQAPRVGGGAFLTALVLFLVSLPVSFLGMVAMDGSPEAVVVMAVLSIILGILQIIFWWIGMAGLCRGTNYLVNQHNARLGVNR
ncbi:MAG: hypothetical protein ACI8UO_000257 [Verrucomicrobiales bacterium]|jgi:hypothetical protein